jgi:glycosyltransferase involved in cell wall biosynthesis
MKYYIVIPSHNEEKFISLTLQSLVEQTVLPKKIVVVNDNSTDKTEEIVLAFAKEFAFISLVNRTSEAIHLPGSKVIQAFQKGLDTVDENYDFIVKADADLIFPSHYFETLISHFKSDEQIGMVGGFAYIEKNGDWDTVDELLCKYYNWKVVTDENLKVKHLKPTGANYNKTARFKQGEAFYSLGYGLFITAIASLKLAMRKGKPLLFIDYINGFWKAKSAKKPLLVTAEQAKFIRDYRWKKMKKKLI